MKPELLLLDEPASGLSAGEVRELGTLIRRLNRQGTTLLIVEHQTKMLLELADEITVLKGGDLISNGKPEIVRQDPLVIEAYLKGSAHHA